MNRIFATFVFCVAAFSTTACGTTTSSGGGGSLTTDTQAGTDTGVTADIAGLGADTAGTDAATADAAKDTAMPMDTMMDTGAMDTGMMDSGPIDTGASTDTAAAGACTNAADKTILDSGKVQDATTTCAMQSMGDATKAAACVKTQTGLSDGCSTCFAGILSCTFKNCLSSCMGGKTPACDQCMIDKGCNADFGVCAGVSP